MVTMSLAPENSNLTMPSPLKYSSNSLSKSITPAYVSIVVKALVLVAQGLYLIYCSLVAATSCCTVSVLR